jgi:hypothetical protein
MAKKIIYLSGPITGLVENNYQAFKLAQEKIEAHGFEVINPHEICEVIDPKEFEDSKEYWNVCMKICLTYLMKANTIVTLQDWDKSEGAKIEVGLARQLSIDVKHIVSFLANPDA